MTQSFRLLADSWCLRNCAGKKFDRIVKRGVPDPRVPCSACIYIPAFKRHTGLPRAHTHHTHGGARASAPTEPNGIYRFICGVDMPGYVFYCFRRGRVSGSYARSDRSSGVSDGSCGKGHTRCPFCFTVCIGCESIESLKVQCCAAASAAAPNNNRNT